jgi:hypothetical protein
MSLICPTGRLGKTLSSPRAKIFLFTDSVNQKYGPGIPLRHEGRIAVVTKRGAGMRWTCWSRQTSDSETDGEGVWFWPPDAEAKSCGEKPRGDGDNKARSPGRARYKR